MNIPRTISNISVYGCGGTGSHIINGLARINYALKQLDKPEIYVTAYDYDTVEYGNIGRQSFFESDVGHNKAKVLIDRINLYYRTRWRSVKTKAPSSSKDDLIISCVDTVKARESIGKSWYKKGTFLMDCGNSKTSGQVVLGQFDGELPNIYSEHSDLIYGEEPDETEEPGCVDPYFRQDLSVNSVVADHALHLVWRLLRWESLEVRGTFFDLNKSIANPVKIYE